MPAAACVALPPGPASSSGSSDCGPPRTSRGLASLVDLATPGTPIAQLGGAAAAGAACNGALLYIAPGAVRPRDVVHQSQQPTDARLAGYVQQLYSQALPSGAAQEAVRQLQYLTSPLSPGSTKAWRVNQHEVRLGAPRCVLWEVQRRHSYAHLDCRRVVQTANSPPNGAPTPHALAGLCRGCQTQTAPCVNMCDRHPRCLYHGCRWLPRR